MWVLKQSQLTDKTHYLCKSKSKYVVGRTQAEILLSGDSSISREHAIIEIKETSDGIIAELTDKGSKYGTYINNGITMKEKMPPNEAYKLKVNDKIRFGMLKNLWVVSKIDLNVVTSTLPTELKEQLSTYINKLGGNLENAWDDNCTHLTMPVITMTMKVVQALCCAIPIVTMDFWKKYYESVMKNNTLPDPDKFIPPLYESLLDNSVISFKVNTNRKSVFREKTFIFLSKRQYGQFSGIITTAGGRAVLLEKVKMSKSALCDPNNIVVQYLASAHSQPSQSIHMMEEIESYLQKKDRRVIPESDIGLAILYCSVEKYCNPLYKYDVKLLRKSLSNPTQLILAPDTDASANKTQKESKASVEAEDNINVTDTLNKNILCFQETADTETSKENTFGTPRTRNQIQNAGAQFDNKRSNANSEMDPSGATTQSFGKSKEKRVTRKDITSRTAKTSLDIEEVLSDEVTQKFVKNKEKCIKAKENSVKTTLDIEEVLSDVATQKLVKNKVNVLTRKVNSDSSSRPSDNIEVDLSDAETQKNFINKEILIGASDKTLTASVDIDMDLSNVATQKFVNEPTKTNEINDIKKRKRQSPERKGTNVPISSFFQPFKKKNSIETNKVSAGPMTVETNKVATLPTTSYAAHIAKKIRTPRVDSDDEGDISFRSTVASSTLNTNNSSFKSYSKFVPSKRKHSDDEDDVFGFVSKEPVRTSEKENTNVVNPFKLPMRKAVDLSGLDWSSKELSQVQADKTVTNVSIDISDGLKRKGTFADEETNLRKKPNTFQPIFKLPVRSKKAITKIVNSTTKNPDLNISRETINLSKITEFNKTDNINYSRNFEKNCIIDWISCDFKNKLEIKREEPDMDDDTKDFIESVRNGIKVYFKKIPIVSKPPVNITDMDVTGVVNFKKFRKTQPLRSKTNPIALVKYVINPREKEVSMENESSDEDTFGTMAAKPCTMKNATKTIRTKRTVF